MNGTPTPRCGKGETVPATGIGPENLVQTLKATLQQTRVGQVISPPVDIHPRDGSTQISLLDDYHAPAFVGC
jgi:hypothetical protein